MTEHDAPATTDEDPQCDCGYHCQGDTLEARVRDGQRHALEAHGIDVAADQVLRQGRPA